MFWNHRPNGISLLLACQNEEAILPLCLQSFLEFADEIIIVDNGSTDSSIDIANDYSRRYSYQIKLLNAPTLTDLSAIRQYGLDQAQFRWIVRGDADFVAYTDGPLNIAKFRKQLLEQSRLPIPQFFGAVLPNVMCDFWHTGKTNMNNHRVVNAPGRYVPPPITAPNPRIYEFFPGFRFQRIGRWELTSYNRLIRLLQRKKDYPLWMHCNIKSDMAYFLRSERTNWREFSDFNRYPTLMSFITDRIEITYGTQDIDEASEKYMQRNVYPFLKEYNQTQYFRYPKLVKHQIDINPFYRLNNISGAYYREYYGASKIKCIKDK